MNRREFVTRLGGAAAAGWPFAANAEQAATPVIGFLSSSSPYGWRNFVAGFRQGLRDTGFEENRNVGIEFRWADGEYDRLPSLAAELVHRRVAVIFAAGGHLPGLAAKAATTSIPIVFESGNDPVDFGLVKNMSRPEGNMTGTTLISSSLGSKQFSLIRELLPKAEVLALLVNPANPNATTFVHELQNAANLTGVGLVVLNASSGEEIDVVFSKIAEQRAGCLIVANDPFLTSRRDQFAAVAARTAIPAIYPFREFVIAGGLMSYGTNLSHHFREGGNYVGKILRGAKPADLPVLQPTSFEFILNLKTATALGLDVPPTLLARADEVIE